MLPWLDEGWRDEVDTWLRAHVQLAGEPEELHRRAWSAMLRVPTRDGDAYFKAAAPALAHEVALTDALRAWRPDCTAELIAVDRDRAWMLMRNAGRRLRDAVPRERYVDAVERVLAHFGQLQVELAPRAEQAIALGMPDRRLARLVELAGTVHVPAALVAELVERVTAYGLPETLVHEEVHGGNVLVANGGHVYVDWSDACVGHPFFAVVVALRSVADHLELEPGAPELERLLDAYLEPWTTQAPRAELRELFPHAYRLGMLNRALSWHAILDPLPPEHRDEWIAHPETWREEFLAADSPKPGT